MPCTIRRALFAIFNLIVVMSLSDVYNDPYCTGDKTKVCID